MRRALLLAIAATLALSAPTAADGAGQGRLRCLRVVDGGPFAAEQALATVRRVLRRRTLTNEGGTIHLTPGTYEVEQVVRLLPDRTNPVRDHYWRLVRRRCGAPAADGSWLVLVGLSQAQLVLPPQRFLVVPTARGWRVAYESY